MARPNRAHVAHYNAVIMSTMASQVTILTIVYSNVYSGGDPRHWPLCWEIHGWPVNSPHKRSLTRKILPFGDVIMDSWAVTTCKNETWPDQTEQAQSKTNGHKAPILSPGPRFNIKTVVPRYGNSHVEDKSVLSFTWGSLYLQDDIFILGRAPDALRGIDPSTMCKLQQRSMETSKQYVGITRHVIR